MSFAYKPGIHYEMPTPLWRDRTLASEFNGFGGQIFSDHERYLEGDCMLEFTQIKTGQLADLLQTVDQRIAVNEELAGGFGHIQIVLEEALNGHERFAVKTLK